MTTFWRDLCCRFFNRLFFCRYLPAWPLGSGEKLDVVLNNGFFSCESFWGIIIGGLSNLLFIYTWTIYTLCALQGTVSWDFLYPIISSISSFWSHWRHLRAIAIFVPFSLSYWTFKMTPRCPNDRGVLVPRTIFSCTYLPTYLPISLVTVPTSIQYGTGTGIGS